MGDPTVLTKVPAFGFESEACYSNMHAAMILKDSKLKKEDFKVREIQPTEILKTPEGEAQKVEAQDGKENVKKAIFFTRKSIKDQNCAKIVGYFPLIGLSTGISHIIMGAAAKKQFSAVLIFRGIMEVLGLGILLLIPDLIVKAVRERKAEQEYKKIHADVKKIDWKQVFEQKVALYIKEYFKEREARQAAKAEVKANEATSTTTATTPPVIADTTTPSVTVEEHPSLKEINTYFETKKDMLKKILEDNNFILEPTKAQAFHKSLYESAFFPEMFAALGTVASEIPQEQVMNKLWKFILTQESTEACFEDMTNNAGEIKAALTNDLKNHYGQFFNTFMLLNPTESFDPVLEQETKYYNEILAKFPKPVPKVEETPTPVVEEDEKKNQTPVIAPI